MKCQTCRWWDGHASEKPEAACLRHAPAVVIRPVGAETVWPLTPRNGRCGDYEPERW